MTDPERARFREFVREAHPDVGGDPDEFVAGLDRFRRGRTTPSDDDRRYDAPITGVRRPRGVRGLIAGLVRWRRRRSGPPRVR